MKISTIYKDLEQVKIELDEPDIKSAILAYARTLAKNPKLVTKHPDIDIWEEMNDEGYSYIKAELVFDFTCDKPAEAEVE